MGLVLDSISRSEGGMDVAYHIVITGLGNKSQGEDFFTGKIRKQFPQWLETEPFQQIVKSYSPCKIKHGGLGAFYIKLRN